MSLISGDTLSPHGSLANVTQLTPDEIDHIDIKEGKTMDERAMMNAGWLDSSKSLQEQVIFADNSWVLASG